MPLLCCVGHEREVWGVAISPDGLRIVSGSHDKTVRIWDTLDGRQIHCLRGHEEEVIGVSFSSNGRHAVSASSDTTLRLWDATTGSEIRCFRGHTEAVGPVAFAPDGARIVSGSRDGTVRIWDTASGREILCIRVEEPGFYPRVISGVCFSPDGGYVVGVGGLAGVYMWAALTGKLHRSFPEGGLRVTKGAFSADGGRLAVGEMRDVIVWDTHDTARPVRLAGHADAVTSVAFFPDNRTLVSGSLDKSLRIWDIAEYQGLSSLHILQADSEDHNEIHFSADGRWLVTEAFDAKGRGVFSWLTWDATTGVPIRFSFDDPKLPLMTDDSRSPWRIRPSTRRRGLFLTFVLGHADRVSGASETIIETTAEQQPIAYFPMELQITAQHPSGRVWAGSVDLYLCLFALEGQLPLDVR